MKDLGVWAGFCISFWKPAPPRIHNISGASAANDTPIPKTMKQMLCLSAEAFQNEIQKPAHTPRSFIGLSYGSMAREVKIYRLGHGASDQPFEQCGGGLLEVFPKPASTVSTTVRAEEKDRR